jgi:oligopeptide transport system permease protein
MQQKTLTTEPAFIKGRSLLGDAWTRLLRNRMAVFSMVTLLIIMLLSILAPYLSPFKYDDIDWDYMGMSPDVHWSWNFWEMLPYSEKGHIFGTDSNGRDLFVRTLYGGRISILVGVVATLVSLIIGVTYGAIAGYVGGKVDNVMMRFVDVMYSLPFMFFVMLLMVYFGRDIILIFAALGAVVWLDMARIVRGQTLSLKKKEFIEAAHALGVSTSNIVRRHIIPNTLGPVVIYMTLTIPRVIMTESFLSFLGLGVQEPMTSWGVLISEGAQQIENAPWSLVFPAFFLALTLFCLNFIGDGIRDALDPKDR